MATRAVTRSDSLAAILGLSAFLPPPPTRPRPSDTVSDGREVAVYLPASRPKGPSVSQGTNSAPHTRGSTTCRCAATAIA